MKVMASEPHDIAATCAGFVQAALDTSAVFVELAMTADHVERANRLRAKARREFEAAIRFYNRYARFSENDRRAIEAKVEALRDTIASLDGPVGHVAERPKY